MYCFYVSVSFDDILRMNSFVWNTLHMESLKLLSAIFIFSPNDSPLKTMKNAFISSKTLFVQIFLTFFFPFHTWKNFLYEMPVLGYLLKLKRGMGLAFGAHIVHDSFMKMSLIFKIYFRSSSQAMADREKRGRRKYKSLSNSRTKRAL